MPSSGILVWVSTARLWFPKKWKSSQNPIRKRQKQLNGVVTELPEYSITEAERDEVGTDIIMHINSDSEEFPG